MNIFEQASRNKLRFPSSKGELTTEQLWDLPLTSRNGFDLDSVAKAVNSDLKATSEESFVSSSVNTQQKLNELKLEVVKHVINFKLEVQKQQKEAIAKREEKNRLMEILNQKQDQELMSMSSDEIKKRIEELNA